jgi:thioredoxin 1
MQKAVIGVVVIGVFLIGGWYVMGADGRKDAQIMAEKAQMEEKAMMEKEEMEKVEMAKGSAAEAEKMMDAPSDMMKKDEAMEDDGMMKKEDSAAASEGTMMKKAGVYAPYEASKLAMANSGDVVLFFKASWCPSCRTLDTNIKANLGTIPSDLTILELDYDTATALKQKYGVTTQHTLVQVDANGTLIKKWSGGSTLASIVEQIQ